MLSEYISYLNNINNCFIRGGIRLPVMLNETESEEELYKSIDILEQYDYFNRVLDISGSGYVISVLKYTNRLYEDILKEQILEQVKKDYRDNVDSLYKTPEDALLNKEVTVFKPSVLKDGEITVKNNQEDAATIFANMIEASRSAKSDEIDSDDEDFAGEESYVIDDIEDFTLSDEDDYIDSPSNDFNAIDDDVEEEYVDEEEETYVDVDEDAESGDYIDDDAESEEYIDDDNADYIDDDAEAEEYVDEDSEEEEYVDEDSEEEEYVDEEEEYVDEEEEYTDSDEEEYVDSDEEYTDTEEEYVDDEEYTDSDEEEYVDEEEEYTDSDEEEEYTDSDEEDNYLDLDGEDDELFNPSAPNKPHPQSKPQQNLNRGIQPVHSTRIAEDDTADDIVKMYEGVLALRNKFFDKAKKTTKKALNSDTTGDTENN